MKSIKLMGSFVALALTAHFSTLAFAKKTGNVDAARVKSAEFKRMQLEIQNFRNSTAGAVALPAARMGTNHGGTSAVAVREAAPDAKKAMPTLFAALKNDKTLGISQSDIDLLISDASVKFGDNSSKWDTLLGIFQNSDNPELVKDILKNRETRSAMLTVVDEVNALRVVGNEDITKLSQVFSGFDSQTLSSFANIRSDVNKTTLSGLRTLAKASTSGQTSAALTAHVRSLQGSVSDTSYQLASTSVGALAKAIEGKSALEAFRIIQSSPEGKAIREATDEANLRKLLTERGLSKEDTEFLLRECGLKFG